MSKLKITTAAILTVLGLGSVFGFISAAMDSGNYQIWADVISTGGVEDSSSNNYQLKETAGEGIIGRSSSTNYSSRAGFREMIKDQVLTLSISANSLELGELSTGQAAGDSHTLTVESDCTNGLSVTFSGATLTCSGCGGVNTISAIGSSAAASSPGTSQFGFNVVYSSGSTAASAKTPYNSSASYAFNSGDEIVSASGAMPSSAVFNVNYIANISGSESSGNYSTAVSYTATASF